MATCVDLKERFGERFKIGRDPSYFAEYGENAITRDPWYDVILCQGGEI